MSRPVGVVRLVAFSALTAGALLAGCSRPAPTDPRMLSEWMHVLYGAIRTERLSPPVASRLAAYASAALYAGVRAGSPPDTLLPPLERAVNDLPPLPSVADPRSVDATLVAVAAERAVLDGLLAEGLPTTRASVGRLADSLVAARVALGVRDGVRARSDSLGRAIGAALLAWAARDGFAESRGRPYVPPVGPGLWVNDNPAGSFATQSLSAVSELVVPANPSNRLGPENTGDRGLILSRPKAVGGGTLPPVNMAGATEPYWKAQRPFAVAAWDACRIPDPPAYRTDTASALHRNARAVVEAQRALTDEQRTIAYYWADNAGESGTPVGHWMSIAAQLVGERGLGAEAAARLLLATALAQGDAFIAAWGYKYTFNLLRPRTYIRRVIDPGWEPLIPTPPFPEYPAGHSTQSMAAATVLTGLLGAGPFSDSTSVALGHSVRRFDSFVAAAEEAGMSRIYGGLHYPVGDRAGRDLGRCIGDAVLRRLRAAGEP
jgi:membrane-associated phospholipid phosphatase